MNVFAIRFFTMSEPAPVILCGKTTQIGEGVIANLKPEYEGAVNQGYLSPLGAAQAD